VVEHLRIFIEGWVLVELASRTGIVSGTASAFSHNNGRTGIVNEHFNTVEHGLSSLPRETFDEAKSWLLQYRASKNKNFKRTNPQKYRNTLTKTIYTLAGKLGWIDSELYVFASEKIGYATPITGLSDLGNNQLELVRDRVRYEHTKRTVKTKQAKARQDNDA